MQATSTIRVAICGGGIGGLSLAVALSRYPHIKVDVYEAAERFQEIGAGLTIWRRTWRVLELLGLADDFKNIADKKPSSEIDIGFEYRRSDLPEGFNLALLKVPYGGLNFHRAHFLDMLVKHLPSDAAHFGKRVLSYSKPEDGGQTTIAFADGTNATCDVLVGCDGVKSVVRRQMLQSRAETDGRPDLVGLIEPCWSGAIAYRGLVPSSELESAGAKHRTLDRPVIYCGQNKHIVAYTVARGQLVNVVAFATDDYNSEYTDYGAEWVASCSKEEVLESYRGWEPEVQALLQKIDNPTKWCIPCLRPLPLYVSDRVALLGDAAHAMTPHLGAGAGQAIEDAYILATALGAAKKSTIDEALKAYEATRLPIANRVLTDARETGRMYEFHGVYGQDDAAVGSAIVRQYEKTISGTPEREATIVLDMINKTSASAKL